MEEGAMCMDLFNVQKLLQAKVLTEIGRAHV